MSIGIIESQAFTANKLAGLKLRLDASDPSTVIESVMTPGNVSRWNDKTVNNNDVTQITGNDQPKTNLVTINGRNAIAFNGSSHFMQKMAFTLGPLSQPNTIVIVWELVSFGPDTADRKIVDGGDVAGDTAGPRHVVEVKGTGGRPWQMWAGALVFAVGNPVALNTPYITTSIFDTTSSEGYINGVQDISAPVSTKPMNGITIGRRFNNIQHLNVKIGEILIYDRRLPTAERQDLEDSLSNKWGGILP